MPTNNQETLYSESEIESDDDVDVDCDQAFFDCMGYSDCTDCFLDMKTREMDWAGVSQNTKCSTVMQVLKQSNICKPLTSSNSNEQAKHTFCRTFHSCIFYEDEENSWDDDDEDDSDDHTRVDCNALKECDWPGIHKSFIGDGICHDQYYHACYNTAVCGYDGGDCCPDTCHKPEFAYLDCGTDGYACRDPKSKKCDPTLTLICPADSYHGNSDNNTAPTCFKNQTLYRIVMYDSFGDGWDDTNITITEKLKQASSDPVFQGGLKKGAEGTAYMCLSAAPSCYHVETNGGMWGREASWFIRGYAEGSPPVANGGAPMSCDFSVAGGACNNTCNGRANIDPSQDADYKDLKQIFQCIDDKCSIQANQCRQDEICKTCFQEDAPEYCYSINAFNAVSDCAICKCSGGDELLDFCNQKAAPGIIIPQPDNRGYIQPIPCTPSETTAGGQAVLEFGKCMDYDKTSMLMTDFDENNFGNMDNFEACAHSFNDDRKHGGRTALECMKILYKAINEDVRPGEPTTAITLMANLLYNNGESFCDCAKRASESTPLCPSFYNFKTLLYESLDACMALDEIDCDAWDEFQEPCQQMLKNKFGSIDFQQKDQCDYIKMENCGDIGPFPSFRRLDCAKEIPATSWEFYQQYKNGCLKDGSDSKPNPVTPATPAPVPSDPKSNTKPPTPYQPIKPSNIQPTRGGGGGKPSNGEDKKENTKPTYKSPDDEKKRSHWFRNMVLLGLLVGGIYYVYKRRSEFSFVRYRRMRHHNFDDGDLYSGLSLESSTTFEPPSLPPTPSTMMPGGYSI
jgi:hypothetical protein